MKTMIKMAAAMVAFALLGVSNVVNAQSLRGGHEVTHKTQTVSQAKKTAHVSHTPAPKPVQAKKAVAPKPVPAPAPKCGGTAAVIAPSYHAPVVGTLVEVLPADAVALNMGGVQLYVSFGTRYQPVYIGGRRMFKVVA